MAYLPDLTATETYRVMTEAFGGYDHNLRIADGSWFDETNLTSMHYPLFSPRPRRGMVEQLSDPQGITAKEALAYVDGPTLYYGGQPVTGITLSTADSDRPQKMVGLGASLCVFPAGVYVTPQDLSDCGSLGAVFSATDAEISLQPCRIDGSGYDLSETMVSPVQPENPVNGQYWIDSSGDTHVLRQYSAASGMWADIQTVYTKIQVSGINAQFAEFEGVHISGLEYAGENTVLQAQIAALNTSNTIRGIGTDYIIITGMLNQAYSYTGNIKVERRVPILDHGCELDNRLWGCRYGMQNGVFVNEIYASALGNPKVWDQYAGIASDSYAVTVGSDGPFTGMISYLGFVLAIKENCIHKIYGSAPPFEIATTNCRGVQQGSERSLCVVNERLYYKSRTDVCMYDGSLPVGISEVFAGQSYSNARAGALGSRYYISMQDNVGGWHMYVYDSERGIWHREDNTCAMMFAPYKDDLYYIDEDSYFIVSATGKNGELEGDVVWEATSGIIGYEYPDQKYMSRFTLRVKMAEHSHCEIYVQYDSDGEWVKQGDLMGTSTQSFTVPVIPRRCDHMQIRLRGSGDVKIYSLAKILEIGSDG